MAAPEMKADLYSIDLSKLGSWLDKNAPQLGGGPIEASFVSGGTTNLVVCLERNGVKSILRSPPLTSRSPQGIKTIEREAMVLRALKGTRVPHPKFQVWCPDADVIGVPFYIMDLVDGWAATLTEENTTLFPERFSQGPDQHYLGYAMIDGLVEMANVDYKAVGLENFGKPDGFLGRQVDRWLGQLAMYPQKYSKYEPRKLPGQDYVVAWLRANLPDTWQPGLMHGDYAMNNVLFAHNPPSRIVAIIDWEMATIGDPVLDLAAYAMNMRSKDPNDKTWSYFDTTRLPYREDAVAYYGEKTGRDVSHMDFYYILYRFRMASVLEYKVAESVQGLSPKAKGERFNDIINRLMGDAEKLARSLG